MIADNTIVVTSGNFTREAEAFARGKPMTLVDGNQFWGCTTYPACKGTRQA